MKREPYWLGLQGWSLNPPDASKWSGEPLKNTQAWSSSPRDSDLIGLAAYFSNSLCPGDSNVPPNSRASNQKTIVKAKCKALCRYEILVLARNCAASFLSSPDFPTWLAQSIWTRLFSSGIPMALFFLLLDRDPHACGWQKRGNWKASAWVEVWASEWAADWECAFCLKPNNAVFVSFIGLD